MDKLTMIVSAKNVIVTTGFVSKPWQIYNKNNQNDKILLTQFEEHLILFYSDFSTNNRPDNDFDMVVGLIILSENCNRK